MPSVLHVQGRSYQHMPGIAVRAQQRRLSQRNQKVPGTGCDASGQLRHIPPSPCDRSPVLGDHPT